jgi:hypothetical protein
MKLKTIIIISAFLALLSCKNRSNESQSDNNLNNAYIKAEIDSVKPTTIIELGHEIETFDWSLTQGLKSTLISNLQRDSKNIDKHLMKFLDDYTKIEKDFNKILFDLSNYDSLNTLAYSPDNIIYENAIKFKSKVEANGFSIAQSEGMIYIAKSTDYIKSDLAEFLNSTSMDFINLYCQEIDSTCCEDAGIIISDKLLVERALLWGNLLEKVQDLEYKRVAESEFYSYLLLIYSGQDNSPSFDWSTGKFRENLFKLMSNIVIEYPNSKVSKEFKEYIELLKQSDLKKTDKIDGYLKNIRNNCG